MSEVNRAIESVAVTIGQSAAGTQEVSQGIASKRQELEDINNSPEALAESAAQLIMRFKM